MNMFMELPAKQRWDIVSSLIPKAKDKRCCEVTEDGCGYAKQPNKIKKEGLATINC